MWKATPRRRDTSMNFSHMKLTFFCASPFLAETVLPAVCHRTACSAISQRVFSLHFAQSNLERNEDAPEYWHSPCQTQNGSNSQAGQNTTGKALKSNRNWKPDRRPQKSLGAEKEKREPQATFAALLRCSHSCPLPLIKAVDSKQSQQLDRAVSFTPIYAEDCLFGSWRQPWGC